MIEAPPKLTIKKNLRRPTAEQVAAFKDMPTSFVVDAMNGIGALDPQIKPLGDGNQLGCTAVGPALTVDTGPGDLLALVAALPSIEPGDIVMAAFGGYQGCAASGDRMAGLMRNNGAAGYVVDGPMRDLLGIREIGLPVWCTGINPNSPAGEGPGKVGLPINMGGRQIETGDMIVADLDGVVVVPYAQIDAVIAQLVHIVKLEKSLDAEVAAGLKLFPGTEELLAADNVLYID
ncbi:MAG: RraA family protein [Granulosicoccaceae bacterium]